MSDEVSPRTSPFCVLPEDCIANIISLTSPKDACRVAAVSRGFKSSADSDTAWERFLPPNHNEIVSRASSPLTFFTKKQLHFLLRDSALLLDGGSMGRTGKTCYTLGARKLQIGSSDDPKHWKWTSVPKSRFTMVDGGLDVPSKASMMFVKEDGTETEGETNTIYLDIPSDRSITEIDGRLSWAVEDDWYEIELGEFRW